MDCFTARFSITTVAAAMESGMFFNEKTVRNWQNEFYNNNGSFKHTRSFVIDDDCSVVS